MPELLQFKGEIDSFVAKVIAVTEVDAVVKRDEDSPKNIYLRTSTPEEELYSSARNLFYAEQPYKIMAEVNGVKKAELINGPNCFRILTDLSEKGGQLVYYYTRDVDL